MTAPAVDEMCHWPCRSLSINSRATLFLEFAGELADLDKHGAWQDISQDLSVSIVPQEAGDGGPRFLLVSNSAWIASVARQSGSRSGSPAETVEDKDSIAETKVTCLSLIRESEEVARRRTRHVSSGHLSSKEPPAHLRSSSKTIMQDSVASPWSSPTLSAMLTTTSTGTAWTVASLSRRSTSMLFLGSRRRQAPRWAITRMSKSDNYPSTTAVSV